MTIKEIVETNGIDNIDIADIAAAELAPSAWDVALGDAYCGRSRFGLSIDEIIRADAGLVDYEYELA